MESEDSFAWTGASSDSPDSELEVAMAYEGESESGKSFKKKLKKELMLNGEDHESTEEKPHSKKKVKREKVSSSPSPAPREAGHRRFDGHDTSWDAEHMLKLKVKEERASFAAPRDWPRKHTSAVEHEPEAESQRKKKKRRRETETSVNDVAPGTDDPDAGGPPKKKKKKRKRENSEIENSFDDPVIDKFEAEETVVETRRPELMVNGNDTSSDAEKLLKLKVKDERASFVVPHDSPRKHTFFAVEHEPEAESPRKKKKPRRETEASTTDAAPGTDDPDAGGSPKKKKKKRKHENSEIENSIDEGRDLVIDKFEAGKTVVETRHSEPKVNSHVKRKSGTPEKPFTSKEFVDDDSSSDDERRAPPVAVESAKPRISQRITFEDEVESPRKKKKRRRETEASTTDAAPGTDDRDAGGSPKKKKKKRIHENSEIESSIDEGRDLVIDKFEAGKTVVETRRSEPKVNGHVEGKSGISEKPFTSKEFVDDDSSSDGERRAPPVAVESAKPRISQRITFEDEPESQPSPSPSPLPSPIPSSAPSRTASPLGTGPVATADRLGRFLRTHAHMQPVIGALERGASVGPDDDVWLLECPRDLAIAALLGATLATDSRSKLSAGGRSYEAVPVPCGDRVALLARTSGFVIRAARLKGTLRLRERVPRIRAPSATIEDEPDPIPLPETRTRHPLLGAAYEQAVCLPPDVLRRLAEARTRTVSSAAADVTIDTPERREKQKKKKKQRERVEPDGTDAPEPDPAARKHKTSAREEQPEQQPEEPSERKKSKKAKKQKKEKRRRDDAELWESEQAIEESLFG